MLAASVFSSSALLPGTSFAHSTASVTRGGNACAKNRQECGACTLASVRLLSVDVPAAAFADTSCCVDEFLGVMAARTSDSESVCVARRLEGYEENQKEAVHLDFFQQRPKALKTTC